MAGSCDCPFHAPCLTILLANIPTPTQVWNCALRDGFDSHRPKDFASLAAALVTFRYDDASSFMAAKRWTRAAKALAERELESQRCFILCLVPIKSQAGRSREVDPSDAAEFASSEGMLIIEVVETKESLSDLITSLGEEKMLPFLDF